MAKAARASQFAFLLPLALKLLLGGSYGKTWARFSLENFPKLLIIRRAENTFTALRLLAYAVNYAERARADGEKVRKFLLEKIHFDAIVTSKISSINPCPLPVSCCFERKL